MRRLLRGPKRPLLFMSLLLALAAASIATGVTDVALPALRGEEPFGRLLALHAEHGDAYLFAHILVHNLGLACLVPGVGFVAAAFERDRRQRRWIAPILLGAVVLAVLVGIEYLFQTGLSQRRALLALVAVEAAAVLLLSVAAYRPLRDFVPTPAPAWSFVAPARTLAPFFLASFAVLAASAWVEVRWLL